MLLEKIVKCERVIHNIQKEGNMGNGEILQLIQF